MSCIHGGAHVAYTFIAGPQGFTADCQPYHTIHLHTTCTLGWRFHLHSNATSHNLAVKRVHKYAYAYMYVPTYDIVHAWNIYMYMCVCMYIYICVCVCVCARARARVCVRLCVSHIKMCKFCVRLCVSHIKMCEFTYIYIYIHVYIYICIHTQRTLRSTHTYITRTLKSVRMQIYTNSSKIWTWQTTKL